MPFTVTANSPSAGSIAWTDVHIVYDGVDYAIANGNTNQKFVWWRKSTPNAFQVSNTHPALTVDDAIVFLNKSGVPINVLNATATDGDLVVPGTVTSTAIATDAITADKIQTNAIISRHITAGSVTADKITANSLSAISANLGTMTAGNFTLDAEGFIKGGATAYNAGTGFWQGYHVNTYKWRVGNPTGSRAEWDGTNFTIYGPDNQIAFQTGTPIGGGSPDAVSPTNPITSANASTYIANGAIGSAQIGSLALVGTSNFSVKTATTGARIEMDSRVIKVYDASGVKRVQIGDLTI